MYTWQVLSDSPSSGLLLDFQDEHGASVSPQPLHVQGGLGGGDKAPLGVGGVEQRRLNVLKTLRHVTTAIAAMSERRRPLATRTPLLTKIDSPDDDNEMYNDMEEDEGLMGLLRPPSAVETAALESEEVDEAEQVLFSSRESSTESENSTISRLELVLEESETLVHLDLPATLIFVDDITEEDVDTTEDSFLSNYELLDNWAQTDNLCMKKKDTQTDLVAKSAKETQASSEDFVTLHIKNVK